MDYYPTVKNHGRRGKCTKGEEPNGGDEKLIGQNQRGKMAEWKAWAAPTFAK